jgi:hypothetical protein
MDFIMHNYTIIHNNLQKKNTPPADLHPWQVFYACTLDGFFRMKYR